MPTAIETVKRWLNGPNGDEMKENTPLDSRPFSAFSAYSATWPQPLAQEAFYGLAGDIVHTIEPHTEADPAALMIQLLTTFGNVVGRKAHFMVEATPHHLNLFAVVVGDTAKSRKGTSWGHIRSFFEPVAELWVQERI